MTYNESLAACYRIALTPRTVHKEMKVANSFLYVSREKFYADTASKTFIAKFGISQITFSSKDFQNMLNQNLTVERRGIPKTAFETTTRLTFEMPTTKQKQNKTSNS